MKKMNIVRNTTSEGTETYRERSRIGSINHRIWSIIAPMLLIAFGLFGVNVNAWGIGYAKLQLYSSPSTGGYVYANSTNQNNIGELTRDDADGSSWGSTVTMYRFAKAKEGYEFRGWATSDGGNPDSQSSSIDISTGIKRKTTSFWAIFSALPKYYFKATATTNSSTYGNAYVTFTSSAANSTTDTEVTTNCYGTHYNTASMTKTAYFRAVPKTGYVFKGWSTDNTEANIFKTDAAITDELTSSSTNSASPATIHYYAIFGEKFAPQINGTTSVNKEVGDSYTADFSFTNTSSTTPSSSSTADFYYTITHELSTSVNNGTNVISYNPSTGAIQALNAGKATITFKNNPTATHQEAEVSFVINVTKKEPTFSCGTSMKVGENLSCTYTNTSANTPTANSSDNFYYVFTNNTPTGITAGSDTPGAILTFSGNKVYGKNAGTATITFYQKETYKYTGATKSFDVTVTKHANTIKVKNSTNYSSSIYVDSYDTGLTLTADNTDYTNCPITNTQTAGTDIATFYQKDKVVYSSYKLGTATWTLSQPENYKYQAGSGNFTINVVRNMNADSDDCYYISDPTTVTVGSWNDPVADGPDIEINGWGTKVSCQAAKSAATAIDGFYIQYKTATKNWTDLVKLNDLQKDKYKDYGPYDLPAGTTHIRFVTHTGATYAKYYRNVNITRATSLSATDSVKITKTSGNQPIYRNYIGEGTATVNWSCSSGENLIAKFDNSKFTFGEGTGYTLNEDKTIATITGSDCGGGTTDLKIHYQSYTIGTDTATLTVYNQAYNVETAVLGTTVLSEQSFRWIDNFDMMSVGQEITEATVHTSMPDNTITYTSDDDKVIRVDDEGTKLVAVGEGTTRITATSLGDVEYATAVIEKYIEVTKLETQYIVWNQSFLNLKLGGNDVTLNATATSDLDCASNNQRAITYSSESTSIVSIVNTNQLKINGVGTTTITAYQAGGADADNHVFAPTSRSVTVVVKDPNAVCESYIYEQQDGNSFELYKVDLSMPELTQEVSFEGEPRTVSFSVKGVQYKLGAITAYKGHIFLDEWYDGTWHEVYDCGEPTEGADYAPVPEQNLHRNATKIRFRRPQGGQGHHYIANVKVTRARYIEIESPIVFENVKVGQDVPKVVTVYYSNVHDNITLTQGQAESPFSLSTEMEKHNCGDHGSFDLTINYNPQAAIEEEEVTLKLSDGKIETTAILRGSASLTSRSIVWDLDDVVERYTVQTETLTAEAQNDLGAKAGEIFYSIGGSSTEGAGVLTGKKLSFTKAGTVYVVAQGVPNDRYNMPVAVTKRFNVSKTPTTISTLPVLEAVTSGTAVGNVELTGWQVTNTVNGGVVEGTLAITSADLINVGTNTVTLTFTPSNTDMYVGCTTTTKIVVNKATSVATPSAPNIVYGQKVSASLLSNDGTEGTWSWTDAKAEDVLDAGTYNGLAVHFKPTSDNYTELDATVSLTVDKANPAVTPQATDITYGQPVSASNITTASGDVAGSWAWAVDDTQVLSVGDHVLKANFTSDSANYNNLSNVDVTLKVKKIEKLEVEVPLSFCAGGEVTFHGNTYTEAGEYQVEAEGATRDTVYNVTVTKLQPTTGTDSKTITVGANESWNGNDLSGYAVGSHEVEFHTTNAAGCDSTVTLSLTVVPLSNVFTNAARNGDWEDPNNWQSGSVPSSEPDIIVTGALEVNKDITVGSLTIESTGSVAVISGGTLTVKGTSEARTEYGDVHVMSDGALALGNAANLQVRDFTLDAKLAGKNNSDVKEAAASGQVENQNQMTINGDAYFQMTFDPKGKISFGWYDFVVPFPVNVLNGIFRAGDLSNHLVSGVDFLIREYSESRCSNKQNAWTNFSGTMQPGRVYTVTFNYDPNFDQNVFVFKNASSVIGAPETFATQYSEGSGDTDDYGWNGLGNGMLQHGYITGTFAHMQVYNHAENKYDLLNGNNPTFAIGTSFFVQVDHTTPTMTWIAAAANEDHPLYAPKRDNFEVEEFMLSLRNEDQVDASDHFFISASEEATDAYVIGRDLRKMGTPMAAKAAQMWATKGGKTLCDIETRMENDQASSDLNFFAPEAQTYTLSVEESPEDATLYLTYNDRIIWSLSASPYTIDLAKGMTEGYGLRIVARHHSPSVATGMDELNVDQDGNRKVLIDNMLYIITPEGAMYSVTGEKVK